MINLNIPVGISDFAQIRQNEYYYVDKSGLVSEILKTPATEVTLITRPRRFGKTLGMSMLYNFFDIKKDSRKLFEGLEISKKDNVCKEWMNQYPVIFLTFKNIDGLNFQGAYDQLVYEIGSLFEEHSYLTDCEQLSENERQMFRRLQNQQASTVEISRSLQLLLQIMNKYYGKQVILLLDEYDVPLAKASTNNYYDQMLEIIKTMMSTALKDNSNLKFAIITGCLKISKESIFTGTNNFVSDTISSTRLNEYFGFTQKDVETILEDANITDQAQNIKKWYDGYQFGDFDVYCPWDVMNYVRDLLKNPQARPESYWKNTSDNAIIRSFIDYAGSNITKKLETLLSGGYIMQRVEEDLTYDYLHSSEDNLWSVLYLTGYLTKVRKEELSKAASDHISNELSALKIPNEEIREIFETTIKKWFEDNSKIWNRQPLFDAVWKKDTETATKEMNKLLRKTISYHDYKEDFYHAFLAGIFAGAGYMVESNKEHGEGRSDVVVYDSIDGRVVIFEAKYSKTIDAMDQDCQAAIKQIDQRMYAKEYEDSCDEVICYGISFYKKRCTILKK
ncbi:MAG: AAA family ATPase [Anaerostipes sp.]